MEDNPPAAAAALDYAPPRNFSRLRRWVGPRSVTFKLLVLIVAAAGAWQSWKWHLRADEQAFNERVEELNWYALPWINFKKPPSPAALRHLARRAGSVTVCLSFNDSSGGDTAQTFRSVSLPNIAELTFGENFPVDAWLKELSHPNSGLTALTKLDLNGAEVTGAGLKELARPDSGLKSTRALILYCTGVTDADIQSLSRPDSGLKSLATLSLWLNPITDAGVKEMARTDSGLKSLTSLNLCWTELTDAGLKELARPDTGLPSLTTLDLSQTKVTDVGLMELARDTCGLKSLNNLFIGGTKTTAAAIAKLKRLRPGLTIAR